ncbi:restriction endonuclease subunit S [Desulfobacterales bacterium HSG2]|nr:restriction endonuclease subunit S [Desulfobacterales bacterium HSG2]
MEDWKRVKLTELADFINGYAFKPSDWHKDGLPIIRIEQLKNPQAKCDFYSGEIPEYNIIDDGDLIFSWSASLFLKMWDRGKAALNQHLFKVVNFGSVNKLFLKYLIEYNLAELTKTAHGSTMQHITRKDLNKFYVNLPDDMVKQTQIATILSKTDQAIEQTEKLIAKYQRIKTGLMQDILTKGIDENGDIRSEETHEFKDSLVGRIPIGWRISKFEHITPPDAPICYGIIQPGKHDHNGIPVVAIWNLQGDFTNIHRSSREIESKYKRSRIRPGDVLLSVKGTTGKVKVVPSWFNGNISRDIARIRPGEGALSQYLRYMLESSLFQRHLGNAVVGTTRAEISIGILRQLHLALPPIDEQQRIASILQETDNRICAERLDRYKLIKIKTGLMQDLLTGKVRVTVRNTGQSMNRKNSCPASLCCIWAEITDWMWSHRITRASVSKSCQPIASRLFRSWYFNKAKEKIIPKVRFYAKKLGVTYNKVMVSDLKYRWGSCTPGTT